MTQPAEATSRPGPGGSTLEPVRFRDLPGWDADDHAAAFTVFRGGCETLLGTDPVLRPGLPPPAGLLKICREALAEPPVGADSRSWFEARFKAWRVKPAEGSPFLTGYYEPEIAGSTTRSEAFPIPALGRPDDLVTLRPGEAPAGLDPTLQAARRTPEGLRPYPDRAAIEDGALDGKGLELLWLPDRVELFLAQVQGSARVVLPDGGVRRLVYAGRNGWPYTSIGRVIVAEGHMDLETMTLAKLKAWLRAHPDDARRIMRLNRSYIFFALGEGMDPAAGPIGAASVPLTPWRSIAVDRTLWSYGLPVWLDLDLPTPGGSTRSFRALTVAQDTGSAILGPARADLFCGWGEEAGVVAGQVRHRPGFVVLLPATDGE
ncbi:MltA domain-containing protein [uncultured Alsobacter sp.]|uniref:murein transglycosylase A n=1 Tax=uncultured Alsobacter sp. TaxID=1748258 RepID=UPI0025FB1FCC|nr:MltA domain-containing protein [uncultured Alsobacter sp.]